MLLKSTSDGSQMILSHKSLDSVAEVCVFNFAGWQKWTSVKPNDAPSENSRFSEEDEETALTRFISMWVTGGSVYWLHGIFLHTQCVKQARQQSRTRKMWQNQETCETKETLLCGEIFRPHCCFIFFSFNGGLNNMQRVFYFSCPAAVLQGEHNESIPWPLTQNVPLFSQGNNLIIQHFWPAGLWISAVFKSIFLEIVANCFEGLNQINLSPVIIGDYKHLDILLFRIKEMGGQLGSNYTAGSPD